MLFHMMNNRFSIQTKDMDTEIACEYLQAYTNNFVLGFNHPYASRPSRSYCFFEHYVPDSILTTSYAGCLLASLFVQTARKC